MKSFKLDMDLHTAHTIIEKIMEDAVSNVESINFGELSKVFSYQYKGRAYVIHFNNNGERFIKDEYLYQKLSMLGIPIPRIERNGKFNDLFFSISEKASGQSLVAYPEDEIKKILPSLVIEYKKMTEIPIDSSEKYGAVNHYGEGAFDTWQEYIESFFQKDQDGFWKDWYTLFDHSFLEKEVFDYYYEMMMELSLYAPKEKYLVHGDFHLGNIISDGKNITGIVDWEMAMYGDFMFDLANLHFWAPQLQIPKVFRHTWNKAGEDIPYFRERLKCGMLFKGIDALRFFAKKEDKAAYEMIKDKLSSI
ncbi:aminoglycoside phosphotransferase family protein [Lederbergia citri]|uniref:Aminoglycoside phosphotransferase family protein n=1 Tax=Lederbergia citri TaxID=2833580 RepID=A0A942THF6_9BACI|nr:aminoglycoside phosphotransferase family protein [Lederbergia citri]MBS4196831.1 aminoglycoside phosphotransferase family protein [Lederbergia citri]